MLLTNADLQRPEHADALHAVRIAFNLPPSRVLPPPSELATLLQHSAPTARGEVTETRGARVEALMGAPVAVSRLGADDLDVDGEAGLPAYAKDDPEPEATRLLDLRLRAIAAGGAASGGGVAVVDIEPQEYRDDVPPPPPPPPPSPGLVPSASFPASEAAAIDPLRC